MPYGGILRLAHAFVFIATLHSIFGHYIIAVWFLLSSSFFLA